MKKIFWQNQMQVNWKNIQNVIFVVLFCTQKVDMIKKRLKY